jgi:hypothetical protein
VLDLSQALDQARIVHALIGGLALGPRGYPRATTDVDFLIADMDIAAVQS